MNINGYVPFLINTLDTIDRGENIPTAFGGGVYLARGNLTWVLEKPNIHVTRPTLLEPLGAVTSGSNSPRRG